MNSEDTVKKFKEYEKLIRCIINKHYYFLKHSQHYEDAYQEGCIALLKAIKTYDTNSKYTFDAYAYRLIWNTIFKKTYFFDSTLKLSRSASEEYIKYKKLSTDGCTIEEIANKLNISHDKLISIINAYKVTSIDKVITTDLGEIEVSNYISDNFNVEKHFEIKTSIKTFEMLCRLFLINKDYLIIANSLKNVKYKQIGRIVGLTRGQVLKRLRNLKAFTFPLFFRYIDGDINFNILCLELLKSGGRDYKQGVKKYFKYVFELPNKPKGFSKEIKQELSCWSKRDFEKIEGYFNSETYNSCYVIDNLKNIIMIIDKYYKFNELENILLKYSKCRETNSMLQYVI